MGKRSVESQSVHDGFEHFVLPVLAPLGFARVAVAKDPGAVGWTILAAECTLPSGARLTAELASYGTSTPRFEITGPSGGIELMCTEKDPAYPHGTTIGHAMSYFVASADERQGGAHLAARRRLAFEFLAAEIAATSDQLVAAVPEIGPRVESARGTPLWRDAARRARTLWENRNVRSDVEDRPVEGKFSFIGSGLVVVEAGAQRYTFRFDTSKIDRTRSPVVSGWWTTPAGTPHPSQLIVGDMRLRFDPSGMLVDE